MQHFSYFAKAYAAALYSGLIYLMANIAPTATHLSDISLLVWIGFAAAILGSFGVTAVVTNGPSPADVKARIQAAMETANAAKQTSFAATATNDPSPATTFPRAASDAAVASESPIVSDPLPASVPEQPVPVPTV